MNKKNRNTQDKTIAIIGAGLVGSLLSIYLHKRGYKINVYEKRPDLRKKNIDHGRSINLALSHRGIKALAEINLDKYILENSIPMKGRMIHTMNGETNFQPYGEEHQMIYSVSRTDLNKILVQNAEDQGVNFSFETGLINIDPQKSEFTIFNNSDSREEILHNNIVIGADGAFSGVRIALEKQEKVNFSTKQLEYGYKELSIPSKNGLHALEKNALHIWPRGAFMLIALPNIDGSFTCTLFLSLQGKNSFKNLKDQSSVTEFFKNFFPDAYELIPELEKDFFSNPTSTLVTVEGFPWTYSDNVALVGDAAHAIVPFYGQGMNAGFEDCRMLNQLLNENNDDWIKTLKLFEKDRKPNTDAIAKLALDNFIEMRDLVDNPKFILRKKIEGKIHKLYPSYLPLYTMVTFTDMPYSKAQEKGRKHDEMMNTILEIPDIEKIWNTENGWKLVEKYFMF